MIRGTALILFAMLCAAAPPAPGATCPDADTFAIRRGDLPATAAAVAKRDLTVVALGGAATLGGAARGPAFAYPARLEARLREALPDVAVKVVVVAVPREPESALEAKLDAGLAALRPALVIWGTGARSAGRGEDIDSFTASLAGVIGKTRATGADVILMTLQYAPSVARLINLPPYRMAVIQTGDETGVPVLDRYELMRSWSSAGFLDFDATDPAERVRVARRLFDCMAEILTTGIVDAVR